MSETLTGKYFDDIYKSFIKFGDNDVISGSLKVLSDGLGNDLPIQVSSTDINFTGNTTIKENLIVGETSTATGLIEVKGLTSGSVKITVPAIAGSLTYTLPATLTADYYLKTDGSGVLSWAAGGSGATLDGVAAASNNATRNHAAYAIEWQWNSLSTGNGIKFSSNTTGRTNTTDQLADKAIVSITATGASSTSNVFSTALYVSNTKTGTGSRNNGIVINNTDAFNINSMPLITIGYQGGGFYFGAASSSAGAMWSYGVTTPSTSNYCISATATDTNINATTTVVIRIGGSPRILAGNAGVTIGGSSTPIGALNLFNNPSTSANYGAICLGGAGFIGVSGSFGYTAGQSAGYSSNSQGTFIASNGQTGWTGDQINLQLVGISYFRVSSLGVTSINVNDKSAVSASAQFQVDSTTKGVLFPRMTGTQAEAISSPTTGLIIYSIDGSGSTINAEGLWQKKAAGWVAL